MALHCPTRRLRRQAFNLIEVVLAMAVIMVGILAILGLVPVGTRAARRAVGDSYAADFAQTMLTYIAAMAKQNNDNWNLYVGNDTVVPQTMPDISGIPADDPTSGGNWSAIGLAPDVYRYTSSAGVYRIYLKRVTVKGSYVEFDAVVRMWKSHILQPTSTNLTTLEEAPYVIDPADDQNPRVGAQLNLEILWPTALLPEDRSRAVYAMQVIK